jgi:predicted nucleic acid-binding protein
VAKACVVDASALAAMVYGEPAGAQVANSLEGTTLVAPTLLPYEMANICEIKCRRDPMRSAGYQAGFAWFDRFGVLLAAPDYFDCLQLARQFRLTAYDAAYLWIALDRKYELVTLDTRLREVHQLASMQLFS